MRALAGTDPSANYACVFCSAGDPVDKPMVHDDACLHARAARWVDRGWMREEGWRLDALRRLEEVQHRLWRGAAASRAEIDRALTGLEAGIVEQE